MLSLQSRYATSFMDYRPHSQAAWRSGVLASESLVWWMACRFHFVPEVISRHWLYWVLPRATEEDV
ncbi:hypothetical protein E2C01_087066 [Portunus trituberculatus]|uniref:Uncharacterized protein n=1 Tax=Portunus trituberculatus TaxID=210409 RepID=A0A5B7JGB0_PORTR|nr:hypothetical protein [Portunus trituberculatus]